MKIKIKRSVLKQMVERVVNQQRLSKRPAQVIKLQFPDDRAYRQAKQTLNRAIKTMRTPMFDYSAVDRQKYLAIKPGKNFQVVKAWLQDQGMSDYVVDRPLK